MQTQDASGGAVFNEYDELDRLLAQRSDIGTVAYQYDAAGRRPRLDAPGQPPVSYGYEDGLAQGRCIGRRIRDLRW